MQTHYDKPCIRIAVTPGAAPAHVKALCSGAEEELIPYEIKEAAGSDAVAIAFTAAEASRLGVGLGLTPTEAALHYAKLKPDSPLFALRDEQYQEDDLRRLGANAARLVKGISFKE